MIRQLRIALLSLIAAAVMPVTQGMAEDAGPQPQISNARPLIRVVDTECRRQCDAKFAACIAEARYIAERGASHADQGLFIEGCRRQHEACYGAC